MIYSIKRNDNGRVFTVGIDRGNGEWTSLSDHPTKDAAIEQIHYLNGGDKTHGKPCDTFFRVVVAGNGLQVRDWKGRVLGLVEQGAQCVWVEYKNGPEDTYEREGFVTIGGAFRFLRRLAISGAEKESEV